MDKRRSGLISNEVSKKLPDFAQDSLPENVAGDASQAFFFVVRR